MAAPPAALGRLRFGSGGQQQIYAGTTTAFTEDADEGQSWQRLENGLPFSFSCYESRCINEYLLLRCSDYIEETCRVMVYQKTGGENWFEIPLPDTVLYPDEIAIYNDFIFVADDGVVQTQNDGLIWSGHLSRRIPSIRPGPQNIRRQIVRPRQSTAVGLG